MKHFLTLFVLSIASFVQALSGSGDSGGLLRRWNPDDVPGPGGESPRRKSLEDKGRQSQVAKSSSPSHGTRPPTSLSSPPRSPLGMDLMHPPLVPPISRNAVGFGASESPQQLPWNTGAYQVPETINQWTQFQQLGHLVRTIGDTPLPLQSTKEAWSPIPKAEAPKGNQLAGTAVPYQQGQAAARGQVPIQTSRTDVSSSSHREYNLPTEAATRSPSVIQGKRISIRQPRTTTFPKADSLHLARSSPSIARGPAKTILNTSKEGSLSRVRGERQWSPSSQHNDIRGSPTEEQARSRSRSLLISARQNIPVEVEHDTGSGAGKQQPKDKRRNSGRQARTQKNYRARKRVKDAELEYEIAQAQRHITFQRSLIRQSSPEIAELKKQWEAQNLPDNHLKSLEGRIRMEQARLEQLKAELPDRKYGWPAQSQAEITQPGEHSSSDEYKPEPRKRPRKPRRLSKK